MSGAALFRGTGRGRPASPSGATIVRSLEVEDLLMESEATEKGGGVVKALRQTHHNLARALSQGVSDIDAGFAVGYTPQYVRILKADPTFAELMEYYAEMDQKRYDDSRQDVITRLKDISLDSLEVIHERVIQTPELVSNTELIRIAEMGMDRIGHGKTATVQHEHSISPESLRRLKAEADSPADLAPEDRERLLSFARGETELHPSPEADEGGESEGLVLREESPEGAEEPEGRITYLPPMA